MAAADDVSYTALAPREGSNDGPWIARWNPLRHGGRKTLGCAAPLSAAVLSCCVVASLALQINGWHLATATFFVRAKGHGGLAKHLDITQVLRKPNFWDLEHIFRGSSSGLLLALFEATGVALPLLRAFLSLAALWLPRAKIRDACLVLLEGCVAKWCLAQIFTGGLMMIVVAVRVRSDALKVTGRDVFAIGAGQESFICSIIVGSFAVNGIRALSDAALPAAAAPPAKAPRRPRMAAARAAAHFVVFCVYVRSLCHPFVTFTYRGASTMFMTTPVKGGGLWDGVVLVPDVISDFYKAMPDDELDITNLMVVLFVWSCVVVPPFATLALLLADVAELGALPGRVRARALRAVRYLAPWSGAGPLAVCSLFVALEIERMIAWLFEKTAHRLGVSIDASVFRVSGAVTPLFYGLCAFALVHEGLQLRALRILRREDDDRRRAAAAVGRAGIQIA